MSNDLQVEVVCLGKVLEGEGKITSTLEKPGYSEFSDALQNSIREVEEADCSACIDGRRCLCQADGSEAKLRPRKAGCDVSTLAMMGMGNKLATNYLADSSKDSEDIFEFSAKLQENLGNKMSGHFDCGAAKGLIKHSRSVSELAPGSQTVELVRTIVSGEAPDEDTVKLTGEVIEQAGPFADVLENCGWNGDQYVQKVAEKEPSTVEKLEVDENDPVGGHAEDAVVVIDGPVDNDGRPQHTIDEEELFKLTGRRAFIVNLNEIRRDATVLGGASRLSARLFAAGLLHHLGGVYKNLGDGSHPLFLVQISK